MKDFYSIKEFCELLGISRSTLYRWIRAGRISVISSGDFGKGKKVIIPATALQELTHKVEPEVKNNGE